MKLCFFVSDCKKIYYVIATTLNIYKMKQTVSNNFGF